MTDKPTLSLDALEFRALVQSNTLRFHEFTQANTQLTADGAQALVSHLERMKSLVTAWHLSQPPTGAEQAGPQQSAPAQAQPNGAEQPARRKGGWPAGKPRKPRTPAAATQ